MEEPFTILFIDCFPRLVMHFTPCIYSSLLFSFLCAGAVYSSVVLALDLFEYRPDTL